MNKKDITIVGAGLSGTLLAICLAEKGHQINLLEKRPDLREADISAGRSINLALSNRGLKALDLVGLKSKVEELCIPMNGRLIHSKTGETFYSPYSGRENEYINSVSRGGLNALLLDKAESFSNIKIYFNITCNEIDLEESTVYINHNSSKQKEIIYSDFIFGTDGAGSQVRQAAQSRMKENHFEISQEFLEHGYKELTIPPTQNGDFRIEKNVLHIWPRGSYMLIALPNLDGSFTVTLFLAYKGGEWNFEMLKDEASITNFFKSEFPDALKHMPNLIEDFEQNPTGRLGTVKCYPWTFQNKAMLMGDAAHAIVPFYGQGMNASFEDVTVFNQLLEETDEKFENLLESFQKIRKIDADAIADLAIDNFYEMRDHVAKPEFIRKRKLEMSLEATFPYEYYSKYSMVTFKEDLSYSEAMKKGRIQDEFLLEYCRNNENLESIDLKDVLSKVIKAVELKSK